MAKNKEKKGNAEQDFFDDTDDITEGDDLPVIPESLRHKYEEDPEKPENSANAEKVMDLAAFLDENTETEPELAPEIDKILDKFSDDEDEDEGKSLRTKGQTRADMEREIRENLAKERALKLKSVRKVSFICVLAVLLIAGGLFAFWQIDKASSNYIMTFDGKKISIEDFKLYLLFNQEGFDPKTTALDALTDFLVYEKAAKEKNLVLSEAEKNDTKAYIEQLIQNGAPFDKLNISNERLVDIINADYIRYQLWTQFLDEYTGTLDAAAIASETEKYRKSSRVVRYILTDKREEGEEARAALSSGLSAEEAVDKYAGYNIFDTDNPTQPPAGSEKNDLYQVFNQLYQTWGLAIANNDYEMIMGLEASEFSEVCNVGLNLVFIPATDEETEEWFAEQHTGHDHGEGDYETEFDEFKEKDRLVKYIVADSKEEAEEARKALADGLSGDEAVKQYSVYYEEEYGVDKVALSAIGLWEDETDKVMSLQVGEYSEVIEFGPFLVIIEASAAETEETVKSQLAYELFLEEFEFWKSEAKYKVNEKAFDNFDADAFFASIAVG